MTEFLAAIQAGGDMALIAIAGAIWKLDRRVLKLETILGSKNDGNEAEKIS